MPRFGPITHTEFMRCLRQLGFRGPYAGGKHQFMVKEHLRVRIPNPHRGDIGQNLLRAILREAGISVAEWENLSWTGRDPELSGNPLHIPHLTTASSRRPPASATLPLPGVADA